MARKRARDAAAQPRLRVVDGAGALRDVAPPDELSLLVRRLAEVTVEVTTLVERTEPHRAAARIAEAEARTAHAEARLAESELETADAIVVANDAEERAASAIDARAHAESRLAALMAEHDEALAAVEDLRARYDEAQRVVAALEDDLREERVRAERAEHDRDALHARLELLAGALQAATNAVRSGMNEGSPTEAPVQPWPGEAP